MILTLHIGWWLLPAAATFIFLAIAVIHLIANRNTFVGPVFSAALLLLAMLLSAISWLVWGCLR